MPSIRTLKIFLAVARSGTFAAAGDRVGLTPAAIGLQIRTLEKDFGAPLFDRSARAAVLNPVGRALIGEIEEIVRRYECLTDELGGGNTSGTVVVGALVSALMGAFADALWSVRQQYPRLDVHLFAGLSSDFARKVEVGELDAAVVTQPPRALPSNLVWTPLYAEPMILIAPARPRFILPANTNDILREAPFLRFDRKTWTGALVQQALDECGASVSEGMELNSIEAIIEIVRQGFGVSIVPRLANVAWHNDKSLVVTALPGVDVQRQVGLLERAKHRRMAFTEAIKAYFVEAPHHSDEEDRT